MISAGKGRALIGVASAKRAQFTVVAFATIVAASAEAAVAQLLQEFSRGAVLIG